MAESNSQPIRCPCGFFGSAQTLGLCSKCFREREESRDRTILSSSDAGVRTQGGVTSSFDISSPPSSSLMPQMSSNQSSSPLSLCKNDFYATPNSQSSPSTVCLQNSNSPSSKSSNPSSSSPRISLETSHRSLPPSPPEPAVLAECGHESTTGSDLPRAASDSLFNRGTKRKFEDDDSSSPSPQKNKRRCYHCNTRLDLALQAIGRCKCDFIFCSLHRLPEQHDCGFDHKETSREEARSKMVVFKKHVGTALKRLDSDS